MQIDILIGVLSTIGAGMLAQWVAWRFRVPAIVLLFAAGLLFGPALGILHPSASLGGMFRPMVSLVVAIIVFEGGMALDFRQLREAGEGVARLTLVALPINWVLGTLAAHLLGHLEWGASALFGAIITVTGPTVVLPLLRHTKLQPRVAAFLRWEAIVNDPVGAILATLVLQVLAAQAKFGSGATLLEAVPQMLASSVEAIAIGIAPAYLLKYLFERDLMPEILKTPMLITFALSIFAVCNLGMEGAGLMGATVFGMALTNLHVPGVAELRRMKESLVVLLVSMLFILLTADLHRAVLERLSIPIALLTLAVLFVVRPLGIYLATLRSGMTWQERVFVGWIAPRGIVAAAVAGVAGIRLFDAGYKSAELITPAVFAVIATTMIIHGFSLRPVARRLKLTLSDEPALAIVGASAWSIDLAACVYGEGVPVLIVDARASTLIGATRRSLPVLRAEVLSYHGQEALEERPADYLIAATADGIYNGMVCAHMAPHFGRQRVFQISPGVARLDVFHGLTRDSRGKLLGEPAWNHTLIETLFEKGWRFACHATTEQEEHPFGSDRDRLDFMIVRRGHGIFIRSAEDSNPAHAQPGDLQFALYAPVPEAGSETARAPG